MGRKEFRICNSICDVCCNLDANKTNDRSKIKFERANFIYHIFHFFLQKHKLSTICSSEAQKTFDMDDYLGEIEPIYQIQELCRKCLMFRKHSAKDQDARKKVLVLAKDILS